MKKNKKKIITIGAILFALIAVIVGIVLYNILTDESRLNINEKKWLSANSGAVHSIHVINNTNIFSNDGSGVFFDFITDFGKEYGLKINPITYTGDSTENPSGLSLKASFEKGENDVVFYQDHFVLVGLKEESLRNINDFSGKKIGVLERDNTNVTNYLSTIKNVNYTSYKDETELLSALKTDKDVDYILLPLNEYIDDILTEDLYINYHVEDIPIYYSLQLDGSEISTIMNKYFTAWKTSDLKKSYDKHNLELFVESLDIIQKDQDTLTNKVYTYGFIENSPYEVIMGGNYGGIISTYLKQYSDFSGTEFRFIKYKNKKALDEAISKNEIDLYFSIGSSTTNEYATIPSLLNIDFNIIAKNDNYLSVNTLKSLGSSEIYVLENSTLAEYLESVGYLNVKTYSSNKDLKKLGKQDLLLAIDKNNFEYYQNKELSNYTVRYNETLTSTYNFKANVNDTFLTLFSKYINSLSPDEMINIGLHNHAQTVKSGTLFSNIALYLLLFIIILVLTGIIILKTSKKVKLVKKIKKEDKIKFIDHLTNLKNRNYLNDNVENWNKNNIYPQSTIIIDLNNVQEINDTLGYDQGDSQIKAAANILIKTQLDNSDIIRTDGNEFLIYLVGYPEKQIVSYMRKLFKEFKNLPFDYGAAMGYSMILDDMKTIEDAMNEAVEAMKNKKEEQSEE